MAVHDFQRALVKTVKGYIKGIESAQLKLFKGIPYAKAPVGHLRWAPPVEPEPWSGVRSAMHFGCEPIQGIDYDPAIDTYGIASGAAYSEDCLYLNVYTPARTPEDRLPVYVWVHGGGFCSGAASQTLYPGETLACKGNMVVVTINYRLGIFGFFSHPELDREQNNCSGNYGLMDQALALRWVKENIAAFGGDPDTICIGGQSAGAISTGLQLFNPETKGLFSRATIQSGPILGENFPILSKEETLDISRSFCEFAGIESLQQLRSMDAWQLFEQVSRYEKEKGTYIFWPCVDGKVLSDHPKELINRGEFHRVDLLCGATSEEFIDVSMKLPPEVFEALVRKHFPDTANRILKHFSCTDQKAFVHLLNDSLIWETFTMASALTKNCENKAFCYYFTRPVRHPDAAFFGAPHSAELPFLFQRIDHGGPSPWHICRWTVEDLEFSDEIIAIWAAFIHGNAPLAEWHTCSEGFVMELGEGIHEMGLQLKERIALQPDIMERLSPNKLRLGELAL